MDKNFGELICVKKEKCYVGVSSITNKALYRVRYRAYFYNKHDKVFGRIDGLEYTKCHEEKSKAKIKKFLLVNGYEIEGSYFKCLQL